MSKRKKTHSTETRKPERQAGKVQSNLETKSRFGARLWKCILATATLVGVVTLLFLLPRLSVNPSESSCVNPFECPFTIINTNIVPVSLTRVWIGVGEIVEMPGSFDEIHRPPMNPDRIGGVAPLWYGSHHLEMDERYTVTPNILRVISPIDGRPNWISGADIAIVVEYRPWFLPIKRRKAFRFVTHKNEDGTFLWYSYPLK